MTEEYGHSPATYEETYGEIQLTLEEQVLGIQIPTRAPSLAAVKYTIYLPFRGYYRVSQMPRSGHIAVDWGMPNGTKLYCPFPKAKVTYTGYDTSGYAYHIRMIDEQQRLMALYAHLPAKGGFKAKAGQYVTYADQVAISNNTGNSTGPHLHMEIRVPPYGYSNCINYYSYLDHAPVAPPEPDQPPIQTGGTLILQNCKVYSRPDISAPVVTRLIKGSKVTVNDYNSEWGQTSGGFIRKVFYKSTVTPPVSTDGRASITQSCWSFSTPSKSGRKVTRLMPGTVVTVKPYNSEWVQGAGGYIRSVNLRMVGG